MKKKRILIIFSIVLVILVATLFVSYGFITADISGNESSKNTVFNVQMIKVEYSDGTETLTSKQGAFTPGSTITKIFTIKNTGNVSVKYSINLDNIINTFSRKKDITYELYSNNEILKNGMYDAKGVFPDNKITILNKDVLNKGESKTYTLKINYLNSEENQIVDSGKILSAKIIIDESKSSLNKLIVYGNSIQNGDPLPDAPVEIESLGDKTKNILPINTNYSYSIEDLDLTIENDIMTLNGTIQKNSQFGIYLEKGELKVVDGVIGFEKDTSNLMTLKPGTYSMSLKYLGGTIERESGSKNGGYFGLYTYRNGVKLFDKRYNFSLSDYSFKFTITEDTDIQFFVLQFIGLNNKATFNNYKIKVQLEEGETATEYEPYGKYKIPVKLSGKNLFDPNKISGGSIVEYNGVKCLKYIDTNTSFTYNYEFKENTQYTVTLKMYSEVENNTMLAFYYTDGTSKSFYVNDFNKVLTFTSDAGKTIKSFGGVHALGKVRYLDLTTTMLEEGKTATKYEPYIEPVISTIYLDEPLRKVGTYADYIDFETSELHRKTYEFSITGDDSFNEYGEWGGSETTTGGMILYGLATNKFYTGESLNKMGPIMCTHYPTVTTNSGMVSTTTPSVCMHYSRWRNLYFIMDPNVFPNLEAWQTNLRTLYNSGNPMKVLLALKEESITDIILPDLSKAGEYKKIDLLTSLNPSNIEVEFDE